MRHGTYERTDRLRGVMLRGNKNREDGRMRKGAILTKEETIPNVMGGVGD